MLLQLSALLLSSAQPSAQAALVEMVRVPDGGIQPQAATDGQNLLHLIYYKGDPKAGDVFYARREPGSKQFSKPIRVNSQPGTAIAVGTIRGAQLAIGKNGRVHVAWNGSIRSAVAKHAGAPMFYSRLNDSGGAFESQRDVINYAAGLDGGGSVAADQEGNVYVVWHASAPGNAQGEAGRAVFVACSRDEGKSFDREKQANPEPTGACGCCGLRAFADSHGVLCILYRGATRQINRDEILLVSTNHGATFAIAHADKWNTPACPMSSASLAEGGGRMVAAWETAGQVYCGFLAPDQRALVTVFAPPGIGSRKHPVAVSNSHGETLLVWTEGTGWEKGGAVAWQLFDSTGKARSEQEKEEGVPVWSLASALAKPDGSFAIVY